MKKSTSITLLTTGIGLIAGLWAWYDHRTQNTPTKETKTKDLPEDNFIGSLEEDTIPITPVSTPITKEKGIRLSKPLSKLSKRSYTVPPAKTTIQEPLEQSYETTQITITNTSDTARKVRLWNGHQKPPLSIPLPEDIQDHVVRTIRTSGSQGTGIYPQGIVVNPYNGKTFIANQLSNSISVLDTSGNLQHTIVLPNFGNPYGLSPTDLTVHSHADSPNYGKVYVVNTIGDSISILGTDFTVEKTIPVGVRPVAIAFNTVNATLYIANIAEDTVSVINTVSNVVTHTIVVGKAPSHITIHPETGQAFVLNSGDTSITVIDKDHRSTDTVNIGGGIQITTTAYSPMTNHLYVVSSGNSIVIPIHLDTNRLGDPIRVGNDPYAILYHPNNGFIYVGNRGDDTFTIVDGNEDVVDTLSLGAVQNAVTIDPKNDRIYSTNPTAGTIALISYAKESSVIKVNGNYFEKREDFIYNPAKIEHIRFVFSGTERFNVLDIEHNSMTGGSTNRPISFSNYGHPQNFSNVAEVIGMKGIIIDGHMSWLFQIAAKQTITIITYYSQIETSNLLEYAILNQKNSKI